MRVSTDERASGPSPQGVVAGFFPAPIAAAFGRARGVDDSGRESAYRELHDTLLAYLGALVWRGSVPARAADPGLTSGGDMSGGKWLQLLCAASKRLSADQHAWLLGPEGGEPGAFGTSALHAALDAMVELRNSIVHKYRHDLRGKWYASIHTTIERLPHFESHVLLVPRKLIAHEKGILEYECAVYRGDKRSVFVSVECDVDLPLNHVLAWDEREDALLDLHPILIEAQADSGALLPELFFADGLQKPSVRHVSDGSAAPPDIVARVHAALASSAGAADPWIRPSRLRAPGFGLARSGPLAPGAVIARRYQIISYLGPGGFADVYEAYDGDRHERIAFKMLRGDLVWNDESRARLKKEILLARSIDHPHIVRYLEHGEDHGHSYVTTELAPGWPLAEGRARTLAQWLAAARAEGRAGLAEDEARGIALEIAQGLAELHEHRVVHRDLKPSNVLLFEVDGERRVKISDFGIARETGQPGLTQPGVPHGTAEYMPPEQTDAQDPAPTMDVYALGILVYELVSGDVPFRGKSPQGTREAHKRRLEPLAERVPGVSKGFDTFVRSCLAKSPSARPANGLEAYKRLLALYAPATVRAVDLMPGRSLGPYAVAEPLEEIPGATLFRASDTITGSTLRLGVLTDEVEAGRDRREEALRRLAVLRKLWRASLPLVLNSGEEDGYHWFGVDDSHRGSTESLRAWLASMHDAAQALLELHEAGVGHERICAQELVDGKPALGLDLPTLDPTAGFDHERDTRALVERVRRGCTAWRAAHRGHERRVAASAERVLAKLERRAQLDDADLVVALRAIAQMARSRSATAYARAWIGAYPLAIAALGGLLLVSTGLVAGSTISHARARRDAVDRIDGKLQLYPAEALAIAVKDRDELGPDPEIEWRITILRIVMSTDHPQAAPPDLSLAPLAHLLEDAPDLMDSGLMDYISVRPVPVLEWAAKCLNQAPPSDAGEDSVYWFLSLRALNLISPKAGITHTEVDAKAMEEYLSAFVRSKRRPLAEPGRSDHAGIAGIYGRFAVPEGIASLSDPVQVRTFFDWLLSEEPLPYSEYWLRGCSAKALQRLVEQGLRPKSELCAELIPLISEQRVQAAIEHMRPLADYRGTGRIDEIRADFVLMQSELETLLAEHCP